MSTKNKLRITIKTSPSELLSKNQMSWIYFIPLLLIAGFVPLIVHGRYTNLTGTTQALFWTGQNELLDFFSYWKSCWVIFLTILSTIIYIFLLLTKKLVFKKQYKYYIPLAIYAIFVVLSTIFAIDKTTAINGFVDMHQGVWVLLSYVMITFLVINFVNSERDVKLFLNAFIFLIIIEGILGIGQYFGFDIFNTKFGNSLIIPSGVKIDGGLSFNFGKHTIYGTLFNTNFVGSFVALMIPMAVVFLLTTKTTKGRIISTISLIVSIFTWFGCNSRAGYVGVAFAILIAIVMLRKYVVKNWKVSLAAVLLGVISIIGLNYMSKGLLFNKLSSINVFKTLNSMKQQNESNSVFKLESIDINKNTVSIRTSYQNLNLKIDENKLLFVNENDETLPIKNDENGYLMIDDSNQAHLRVQIDSENPIFYVHNPWGPNGRLSFYIGPEGIEMIGSGGRLIKPIKAKSFALFDGLESIGSNRGYIWGRTIPLLGKYIFYGAGADNYPIAFPQNDIVVKANTYYAPLTVIDKPHNMYLQIAINTGVISLISLLVFWIIYIVQSFKLYWNTQYNTLHKKIGLACMIAVIGYLVAGIFNDQIVSVAPLFWLVLGIGVSVNRSVKSELKLGNKIA